MPDKAYMLGVQGVCPGRVMDPQLPLEQDLVVTSAPWPEEEPTVWLTLLSTRSADRAPQWVQPKFSKVSPGLSKSSKSSPHSIHLNSKMGIFTLPPLWVF